MHRLLKPAFALFFTLTAALAQAGALDAISNGDASAGVKEALAKGADYAVSSLGKSGGFLGNDKVKIGIQPGGRRLLHLEIGLHLIDYMAESRDIFVGRPLGRIIGRPRFNLLAYVQKFEDLLEIILDDEIQRVPHPVGKE